MTPKNYRFLIIMNLRLVTIIMHVMCLNSVVIQENQLIAKVFLSFHHSCIFQWENNLIMIYGRLKYFLTVQHNLSI